MPAIRNPYGEGGASKKIVDILQKFPMDDLLKKSFHDINFQAMETNR